VYVVPFQGGLPSPIFSIVPEEKVARNKWALHGKGYCNSRSVVLCIRQKPWVEQAGEIKYWLQGFTGTGYDRNLEMKRSEFGEKCGKGQ
jgi:hypothetical protein